ncbi:unnamed protein product [Rotaria magnacalcarata]|uniref:DUF1795 domain-containing protein n=1 Tax=Rotaria magnacalcarata TaxID=392030 RepID=A0A816B545_9BILA|nr:unnamed protein product [Rotaria magnacalcarata]
MRWLILLAINSVLQFGDNAPIGSSEVGDPSPSTIQSMGKYFYKNSFLSFSIEKPENWHSASFAHTRDFINGTITPLLAKNNILMNDSNTIESERSTLFIFSKLPLGNSNSRGNTNIVASIGKVDAAQDVINGCDFIVNALRILNGPLIQAKLNGDCREVYLNGEQFSMQEWTTHMFMYSTVYQMGYVKIMKNDYTLLFILSYRDLAGKREVNDIMRSLTFSKE